jgi:hypothetical protein
LRPGQCRKRDRRRRARQFCFAGDRRSPAVRWGRSAIGARDNPRPQRIDSGIQVSGARTSGHFLLGLREQEKADAKENTNGHHRDEPDED